MTLLEAYRKAEPINPYYLLMKRRMLQEEFSIEVYPEVGHTLELSLSGAYTKCVETFK